MSPVAPGDIDVVADSDVGWAWGAELARRLTPGAGLRVRATLLYPGITVIDEQSRGGSPSAEPGRPACVADVLPDLAGTDARVVVLACAGERVQALLHALASAWDGRRSRPIVITAAAGPEDGAVEGVLLRAGADVLLADSAVHAQRLRAVLQAIGLDPDSVVSAGRLLGVGRVSHDPNAAGRDRPFTVAFVSPPGRPETRADRRCALAQVVEHAARYPDRHVIVAVPGGRGRRATSAEPYPYPSLLPDRKVPGNVEFVDETMSEVLDRTDLCVTVSADIAFEAMQRQVWTAVLVDFGVGEAAGNQLFLHSGALLSWAALHAGAVPTLDPEWAARNGVYASDPQASDRHGQLARRVNELTALGPGLPPLRPWYECADTAGYLPALLRRHGLDPTGRPRPGGPDGGSRPSMTRRAVQASARRMYRVGVGRLEPRIRRWAQL